MTPTNTGKSSWRWHGRSCEACGSKETLSVHHIVPRRMMKMIRWQKGERAAYLRVICRGCHDLAEHHVKRLWHNKVSLWNEEIVADKKWQTRRLSVLGIEPQAQILKERSEKEMGRKMKSFIYRMGGAQAVKGRFMERYLDFLDKKPWLKK